MADTHPEDVRDTDFSAVLDRVIVQLMKYANNVKLFYTRADTSMLITAAIFAVSILLSLAILDQGSKHSVFREGISWNIRSKKLEELYEKEKAEDEAEQEIFESGEPIPHPPSAAEEGAVLFLSPLVVKVALMILVGLFGGAVIVTQQ